MLHAAAFVVGGTGNSSDLLNKDNEETGTLQVHVVQVDDCCWM